MRLEIPNPKTGKHRLQPVDQLRLFTNQPLTFAGHAAGIFLLGCGNCDHPAMALLTTQPPQKGPHHQLTIKAISLCPAMVPFHRDTRGMHHMRFDTITSQTARQPKTVATGLVSNADARDPAVGPFLSLGRLVELYFLVYINRVKTNDMV